MLEVGNYGGDEERNRSKKNSQICLRIAPHLEGTGKIGLTYSQCEQSRKARRVLLGSQPETEDNLVDSSP
jgi:hypothetical protein